MPEPPDVLTFLFSDIEGSTRLWEQQPGRMRPALAGHDAVARACVEGEGGTVVKSTGDGIHAVFADPLAALRAALQLQIALADPAATHGLALRVRCGLHLGTPERRDGDYFGTAVNRAARVMSVAHGGQTLLSEALADRLLDRLPPGVSLRDLGRVRLRDLADAERVYQLQHALLRAEFPPLRSLEATPNNLAQQLNSFVGRERELAEVRGKLATSRLLTLLGMGGIGKSRLSVQLGAEVLDDYPDGVWLVELAPLTDGLRVPQAVASVLGLKEEAGHTLTETLARYVHDKQLLFILDNCEHVLQACAELAKRLLQAGARVTVLASSRDALQVAGEISVQVPTLAVPAAHEAVDAGTLMRHEAVRLFVDRASAVAPGFAVTAQNAAAVAAICQRLDGIPLAIELAAARTRALSVQAIAARLHDRFRLLVSGDQTVLPRQRTLRALIDWSHDLLAAPERLLFRRLAVFAGGWTLEAAEAVCSDDGDGGHGGDNGLGSADVLDPLAHLVEKSLVVMEPGGARYRMLDTVRHYALERLEAAGDAAAVRTRHLGFYLAAAEAARPGLAGPEQGTWLARLDLERENFLLAHGWSASAHGGDALGLRLVHALRPYWIHRGNLTIGLRLAEEIMARPGLQARDESRCMALFAAGQMCFFMGLHAQALQHLAECLAIARETGNAAVVARVLQPLGMSSLEQRNFADAERYLAEALALARGQGDARELAAALNALAMLHRMQLRFDLAEPLCAEAVALARRLRDQEAIGIGLLNLAMVAIGRGALHDAATMLSEVTVLAGHTGSQVLGQSAVEVCAGLAAAWQQWPPAAVFFGAAEALRESAGLRRDPADEAFLSPWVEATRNALGADAFARHCAEGRDARQRPDAAALQRWLASAG